MKQALIVLALFLAPTWGYAMEVTSSSIEDGVINTDSACEDQDGNDISPQISISGAPEDTTYFALIMDDPDAKALDGKTWVHWNVVNIPAESTTFAAGETPPGVELENSDEDDTYGGMCPTDGRHTYRIGVFALSAPIETDDAAELTLETFKSDYGDQILDAAVLEGAFP